MLRISIRREGGEAGVCVRVRLCVRVCVRGGGQRRGGSDMQLSEGEVMITVGNAVTSTSVFFSFCN